MDITAATTVNLTDNHTIGNRIVGDTTTSSAASWILAGDGGELTLAGGTPTITVNPLGVNAKSTISAVINGSSGLTKAGEGTLLLTGSNTFTGGVVIEDGSLKVTSEAPLTNAGTITIGNGSGNGARLSLSGILTLTNAITIGSGASGIGNGAIASGHLNAVVSGNITITDATPGGGHFRAAASAALTLEGKITYAGNTVTQRGGTVIYSGSGSDYASIQTSAAGINTIMLGADNGLATGATVDLASNASLETFDLAGFNQSVAGLKNTTLATSTNSIVTNSGGSTSTLTLTSGTNTFGGVIQNGASNMAIVVNGANQTLSGVNTYTGNTTISSGTLELADNAELRILVGANGVNNQVNGSGTITLDGALRLDLTGAGAKVGNSWNIITVGSLAETFGGTFMVESTRGNFSKSGGIWSISENGVTYMFSRATGLLTVAPKP